MQNYINVNADIYQYIYQHTKQTNHTRNFDRKDLSKASSRHHIWYFVSLNTSVFLLIVNKYVTFNREFELWLKTHRYCRYYQHTALTADRPYNFWLHLHPRHYSLWQDYVNQYINQ